MLLENRADDLRRAYENELRLLAERSDILDSQALRSIRKLLRDIQPHIVARINEELLSGRAFEKGSWGSYWIPKLLRALNESLSDLSRRTGEALGGHIRDAWELGVQTFENPVMAVTGVNISAPAIDLSSFTVASQFSARLITNIDESLREIISKAIRVNVVTGDSPTKLLDAIARTGLDKGTWPSVASRAEAIVRTELAFLQTTAAESRMKQAVREYPQIMVGPNGLKQVFVSEPRGEYPCEICEPYNRTVWDIDDPEKPKPPLHPHCRCTLSPFFPGISSIKTVPTPTSRRQRNVTEACGCKEKI